MSRNITRQSVKGDAAAQVVDVVQADIGGEPAQQRRQIVMRTAMQARPHAGPTSVALPKGMRELVLDVEQPHASEAASSMIGTWTSRKARRPAASRARHR